jgi:hypothetical protein
MEMWIVKPKPLGSDAEGASLFGDVRRDVSRALAAGTFFPVGCPRKGRGAA